MKLFVGNVPKQVTDSEFNELVAPFGAPQPANLVKDRSTGESRGFGFVQFQNDDDARAAIAALHGKVVGGQALRVAESQPKPGSTFKENA